LACRVALEAINVLNDESLMASVSRRGHLFRETLREAISAECRVDGRGFATVIDLSGLSNQGARGDDAARIAWDWVRHAQEQGLLVHLTGVERNRIAIIPPLNMGDAALQQAIEILSSFWKVK
jgi:4-aminobutyrate aminotransferase-like enzyme